MIYLRWESDLGTNTTTTHLVWQCLSVVSCARRTSKWILLHVTKASMAELFLHCFLRAEHRIADDHAEALCVGKSVFLHFLEQSRCFSRLPISLQTANLEKSTHRFECSYFRLPIIRRNIINRQSPILPPQSQIRHLRHPLKRPIPRFEIQIRSPVITKVLAECTARTTRLCSWVVSDRFHGRVE